MVNHTQTKPCLVGTEWCTMQDLLSRSDRSCLCWSHSMCTVKLKGKLCTATAPGSLPVWQAWQNPLTISKVLWLLYSGLLGLESKISQISSWVLQLLVRIPLTANLDVWKSPKSVVVFNLLVSFPGPQKISVQKNFYFIKTPYKIPLKPMPKDECPFGCHYIYHSQKCKQQDQW